MDEQAINRTDSTANGAGAPADDWSFRRRWPLFLGLCLALAIWCVVDVRCRARVLPDRLKKHRTDITVYTTAGAAFFEGRDPYEVTNPRGWHYLYPPLFALLISPLHYLPTQWQAGVWFAFSAAMCFGCFFECRRIARFVHSDQDLKAGRATKIPEWIGLAAFLAVLLPTLNCLQRGQVGVVVLYLLLLGFRLVLTGRSVAAWFLGGLILAAPVTLKLTPLLPVAFLVFQQAVWHLGLGKGRREVQRCLAPSIGVVFGLLAFVVLIPALMVGWNSNLAHFGTWMRRVVANREVGKDNDFNPLSMRNQSMGNAVYRLGNWAAHVLGDAPDDRYAGQDSTRAPSLPMDNPAVSLVLNAVRMVLLLLLLSCGVWQMRRGDALDTASSFGLACASTLLISPLSWGHHYTVFLPAALFVPLWLWTHGLPKIASTMAAVPVVLSFLHYMLLDFTGRVGVLGIGTTFWFVGACALVLLYHNRGRSPRRLQARNLAGLTRTRPWMSVSRTLPWMRSHNRAGV